MLNKARAMELQAIHQYMNHHYNLDDSDYGEMAAQVTLIAIDEMRHAEMFAERIKELGGEPTTELAGKVEKGQEVESIFAFDAKEEDKAIVAYSQFLSVCQEKGDTISTKLLEWAKRIGRARIWDGCVTTPQESQNRIICDSEFSHNTSIASPTSYFYSEWGKRSTP